MKRIVVRSPQGGCGKTTIAKGLASLGYGYKSLDRYQPTDGGPKQGVLIIDTGPYCDDEFDRISADADVLLLPVRGVYESGFDALESRLGQILSVRQGKPSLVVQTCETELSAQLLIKMGPLFERLGVPVFSQVAVISGGKCHNSIFEALAKALI